MSLDDVVIDARLTSAHELDGLLDSSVNRRSLLKAGGFGLAILASAGFLRTPVGSAVAAIVRRPLSALASVEGQIFQTAASLENLTVATYAAALELPFVQENPFMRQFAETTMQHHAEHGDVFNDQAERLGAGRQDAPNPKYAQVVESAKPGLTTMAAVVDLTATLEEVATDTYLANLTLLGDPALRTLMASIMGVASQHLATIRLVGSLMAHSVPQLAAIPTDVAALPADLAPRVFPLPFEVPDKASPPNEGALR